MFKINDQVVCVDDKKPMPQILKLFNAWITQNEIYTVRGLQENIFGDVGLLLKEIKNPSTPTKNGEVEPGYAITRFRKLEDILAEISIEELEEVLNTELV